MRRTPGLLLGLLPAAASAAAAPTAGYDDGFFVRSEDGRFALEIGARLQFRYTWERADLGDDDHETFTAFSIRRGRLSLSGHAWSKALLYKFQAGFDEGSVELRDFYVDYGLVPDALWVRAGQFKVPFSRQQITSSGDLLLVDRAPTDKFFGAGRDIGVLLSNRYDKAPEFEWALGVFNGTGAAPDLEANVVLAPGAGEGEVTRGRFSNVPDRLKPAVALRAAYNHGGIDAYSEGDLVGGPLRFAVGASAVTEFDADDDGQSSLRVGIDGIVKVAHFSVNGEFFTRTTGDDHPFDGLERDAIGGFVQAGYLFGATMPVFRYSVLAPEGDAGDLREVLGGLNVFFHGHDVKWQTDAGVVQRETDDGDLTDVRVRSQVQVAF